MDVERSYYAMDVVFRAVPDAPLARRQYSKVVFSHG